MQPPLFTRTEPMLLPYFPRLFYLALREQGFEDTQIFDGIDLSADQLDDETYRLSIEQHEQLILRMLDLTEDPHFALRLSDLQENSVSNLPMLVAAHSGQIARALQLITRYSKILTRVFTVQMVEDDDSPRMDLTMHVEHDSVVYFAVSSYVLFLTRFFREAACGAELVRRVDLSVSPPDGFESVRRLFPCEVLFDQPRSSIHLSSQCLDQPMRKADPQTVRLLTDMAEKQLQEAESETSLEGAIKLLLVDQVASPPSLDEAAQILGLSSRSLRRKLASTGTTYQRVLDAVRLAVAQRLIRETESSISSIAYELGFSHPSDFGRAFKKWSGITPLAYRNSKT